MMFKFFDFVDICYYIDKDFEKYFDINILKEYEGEVLPDILINHNYYKTDNFICFCILKLQMFNVKNFKELMYKINNLNI